MSRGNPTSEIYRRTPLLRPGGIPTAALTNYFLGCILALGLIGSTSCGGGGGSSPAASNPVASNPAPIGTTVSISINAAQQYQKIEGFGATTESLDSCGIDQLGAMRPQVLDAVYNQVKLTMGDIQVGPYEGYFNPPSACGWDALVKSNDNSDPNTFNWSNFQWWKSDYAKTALVDLARPMGFDNFQLHGTVSTRWADQWLNDIRTANYSLYLQEAAENVVAIYVRWRDAYGIVPQWGQPFNEPLSGNYEVAGGTTQEIVDLVKAIGARLRAEGFGNIMLVVASETNESKALQTAQAILSDPVARQYVGAISYHTYGGVYGDVSQILSTSGSGKPDAAMISVRNQIRDLANQYGLQTWMTEICCSSGSAFDIFRARAIQIHDEMIYANASSYWGLYNIAGVSSEDGSIVTVDGAAQTFKITAMGRAIGHYARWVSKGAVRVDAGSNDPLVQITAFRDALNSRLTLVVINNASQSRTLSVNVSGLALAGGITGEQSTATAYWQTLTSLSASGKSGFTVTVPAMSVTTLVAQL